MMLHRSLCHRTREQPVKLTEKGSLLKISTLDRINCYSRVDYLLSSYTAPINDSMDKVKLLGNLPIHRPWQSKLSHLGAPAE